MIATVMQQNCFVKVIWISI